MAVVTGATGAVGRGLVSKLVGCGYTVRAYARNPPSRGCFPDSVEVVTGAVTDRVGVRRAVQGADVVFHLAAKLHINAPGSQLLQEFTQVNVEGTRVVAEESCAAGVKRLVFFSTICVYGPTMDGVVVDEDAPVRPCSAYARTKLEAEAIVRAMRDGQGAPLGVVLRLAAVYGTNMKGNYRRVAAGVRQGWFLPVGNGRNRRTLVHEDDVVRAALLAARHPNAPGRVFNVTDGSVHEFGRIVDILARHCGRAPRVQLPLLPVRTLAKAVDAVRRCFKSRPLFLPLVEKMIEDVAVSGDRVQIELGFEPSVSLDDGLRRTLRCWYPSTGA
jgi:nucleoside-diphosphate-sugar epimerase